jgi:tetratricopeptide (TPR) repeat protein
MEYILRIQSLFRVSITRRNLMNHLATYIFLVKADGYEGDHYYYLNTKTGETSWEKPKALLGKDLPPEPMHKWVRLWYHTDAEYYINPYSGKYTHLSVAKAGHIITSLAKNYLAKPYHLTVNLFKKGYQFDKTIKVLYEKVPNKLGNIVNYAIVSHAVHHNYPKAKKLYADALQLADASPLLVRAYAIFLIGNCEPPVLVNKEKAISIFKDANRKDPSVSKFTTAFNVFFKYACICDPNNCYNLLNLGLVYYYIYSNISIAEKLFRRALAIAPFDERVTQNWSYVKDMFVVRNGPYLSPTLLHDNKAINIQLVESEHNHDSNDEIHKALLLEHDNRLKKVHALKHVGLLLSQSKEIPPDHPF